MACMMNEAFIAECLGTVQWQSRPAVPEREACGS